MKHYPDFETFKRLAAGVELVPVYRRLLGDALTPVSAFHKIDAGASACLFESVIGGEKVGRYSFLAADPFLQIEARGNRVTVTSAAGRQEFTADDPLEELKRRVEAIRSATLPELPPFTSGAVGYAGYDVIRYSENLPNAPAGRSPTARPGLRLLRSHGGLRPREQDQRRGGHGTAGQVWLRPGGRLRRCPAARRRPGGQAGIARPPTAAGRHPHHRPADDRLPLELHAGRF